MNARQATIADLTVLIENCQKRVDDIRLDRGDREHLRRWMVELKAQRRELQELEMEAGQ